MNKRDYLNEHPWPAELLQRGKLVDSLWQFEFPYGLDVIWAVVTDTSRLNRRLSYGEMHFTEKDGRLHGEA
ncbi:MAG: adenylate/guanylate cyclase domain-containing protein, partial [Leptospiraceae bacterium]|nr:adenylate/guanylate cyclase domain-containing protein [Leptospiraceae bacterium]